MANLISPIISDYSRPKSGTVAIGCLSDRPLPLASLDDSISDSIQQAAARCSFDAADERRLHLDLDGGRVQVTLYGLGPLSELEPARIQSWLDAVGSDCTARAIRELLLVPPAESSLMTPQAATTLLRQVTLLSYSFDQFKQAPARTLRHLRVLPPPGALALYRRARKTADAVARGVAFCRDLANTPPNRATPAWMARQARGLADRLGAKIRVLGPKELQRLEMRALLAVGQGSANTPRLVRLEIGSRGPLIALVGKGITFDSGGISIKPSAGMDEMKFDKAGACTVLGVAQAIAELALPVRLSVYLPLAENMPGGRAYRPGDIVRTRSGKTVEVLNTDAEGRLVLADAISLAIEEKPEALIEFSTLTGATVVALGLHGAALYSPHDRLAEGLLEAAADCGERLWRMPLWPEFRAEMKGRHADLRNLAGRWGGGNTAAAFLAEFMGEQESWAHLDIAGSAWISAEGGDPFGATGFGVAATVSWLMRHLDAR